jgi:hypothetical protein
VASTWTACRSGLYARPRRYRPRRRHGTCCPNAYCSACRRPAVLAADLPARRNGAQCLIRVLSATTQVYGLMERGAEQRATGATKWNEMSSRSHAVRDSLEMHDFSDGRWHVLCTWGVSPGPASRSQYAPSALLQDGRLLMGLPDRGVSLVLLSSSLAVGSRRHG